MKKYLLTVIKEVIGVVEIEANSLEEAIDYCHPDEDEVREKRDSEEGWFYSTDEPYVWNAKTKKWVQVD